MGKHMEEWARARRDADYPEGAVKNAWMDELARAILADAEEVVVMPRWMEPARDIDPQEAPDGS